MPCYRPVSISNPSRKFANDMPLYLHVPCGKCEGCRKLMRNEWFFRSYIEYLHTLKIGGVVYVFTLTFNDENLPKYTLPSGEVVSCFNKRLIHNFIKYFRILVEKSGYYHKEMKYLICSEFGERFHRPHHHGLMFFPYQLPEGVFLKHLRTAWHYGFVGRGNLGFRVRSPEGLEYVSKYITKDLGCCSSQLPREFAPNHWQSVGFGSSFIDDVINKSSDVAEYMFNNRYTLSFDKLNFPIPRYYHLKVERKINKEISKQVGRVVTELTPVGKQVRLLRFKQKVDNHVIYLKTLNRNVCESSFPQWCSVCSLLPSDSVFDFDEDGYNLIRLKCIKYICRYVRTLDLRKISYYCLFLREYPIGDIDPSFYILDVDSLYLHTLDTDYVPPEYIEYGVSDSEKVSIPLRDDKERLNVKTCRSHWYYRNYERIARSLDLMSLFSGLCSDSHDSGVFKNKRIVKELYSKYVEFQSF